MKKVFLIILLTLFLAGCKVMSITVDFGNGLFGVNEEIEESEEP